MTTRKTKSMLSMLDAPCLENLGIDIENKLTSLTLMK